MHCPGFMNVTSQLSKAKLPACVTALICLVFVGQVSAQDDDLRSVVVTVNGTRITRGHVELLAVKRGITSRSKEIQEELTRLLIERYLVDGAMTDKRMKFDRKALRRQVELTRQQIRKSGADPDEFLKRIGFEKRDLTRFHEPALRWSAYLTTVATEKAIAEEFQRNKTEYDGTRVMLSQVLIKASKADKAGREAAVKKLNDLRRRISAGEMSFADAARKHSQAPSAADGGNVGWITWAGKVPSQVSAAAFKLQRQQISAPVESTFGVHLCQVTERKDGDLSPEDARAAIVRKIAKANWDRLVASEKGKAKIQKSAGPN